MSSHYTATLHAMGSDCSVTAYASTARHARELAELGTERIGHLHRCWTRFDTHSSLSRLNQRAGSGPVTVGEDLMLLVEAALHAYALTHGLVDASAPDATHQQPAHHYQTRVLVSTVENDHRTAAAGPGDLRSRNPLRLTLTRNPHTVDLPRGSRLDPGGIGKGLAGDIVARELTAHGATGVLVDAGGDIVVRGTPARERDWQILIHGQPHAVKAPHGAGIATSSTISAGPHGRYHIVDPRTGGTVTGPRRTATVIAPSGLDAEAMAKATLLAPEQALPDIAARNWWASTVSDADPAARHGRTSA